MWIITVVMMMNVIDDEDDGYVRSLIYLESFNKDVVGTINMFIKKSSRYSDNDNVVNVEDD